MSEQIKKLAEDNMPTSFRPSSVTREQIAELMERFNENQTQTLSRCIERMWAMEIGVKRAKGKR
jgi:hypothetical protein